MVCFDKNSMFLATGGKKSRWCTTRHQNFRKIKKGFPFPSFISSADSVTAVLSQYPIVRRRNSVKKDKSRCIPKLSSISLIRLSRLRIVTLHSTFVCWNMNNLMQSFLWAGFLRWMFNYLCIYLSVSASYTQMIKWMMDEGNKSFEFHVWIYECSCVEPFLYLKVIVKLLLHLFYLCHFLEQWYRRCDKSLKSSIVLRSWFANGETKKGILNWCRASSSFSLELVSFLQCCIRW